MAYAKTSLLEDVRQLLEDDPWETTSTTTGTGTTVAVPDGTKWAVGDIGEWSYSGTVGGEQFLVQSIATNDLTVVRGYNGTTAESHSSGDRVVKNARYSTVQIADAVERVVSAMYPQIWKQVTSSITPDQTTVWFNSGLGATDAAGVIDLIRAEQRYGGSSERVGIFGSSTPDLPSKKVRWDRLMPTALVSSGIGLNFPSGFFHTTNTVTVRWRVKVTSTLSGSNYADIDEGLLSEAVVYGVCARLVGAKELSNVSEAQKAGDERVGSFINTAAWFELKQREIIAVYHKDLVMQLPSAPDQNYIPGWW